MISEDSPLNPLNLSKRTKQCFQLMGIKSLEDITMFTESEFLAQKNFGKKCLNEVRHLLNQRDLTFKKAKDIESDYYSDERINKMKTKFLENERNKKIIHNWNKTSMTLEEIAEPFALTRERARQIIKKASSLGLTVVSVEERLHERKDSRKEDVYEKYKTQFIELYKTLSHNQIAQKLDIPNHVTKYLEKRLLKEGLIEITIAKTRNQKIKKVNHRRRSIILEMRKNRSSLAEIALFLGCSKPTVCNEIRNMKDEGILVPFSQNSGSSLDEDEIEIRSYFIEEKIKEGWSKTRIAKALGLSSGHAITNHIDRYL